ncbi:MAG: DUF1573 domain-containing protein [Bacteroidota bacterium]|nr:DUF1573 domain-containing protein [Bacteroidota bacterium]
MFLFSFACNDNKQHISPELITSSPVIEIQEESFDFGEIYEGEIVQHKFKVTNIGDGSLIITSVKASCGCTVARWSKESIPSGKDGFVEVTFDSKNRKGIQKKTITLLTNSIPNITVLTIKGNVIN